MAPKLANLGTAVEAILTERRKVAQAERMIIRALKRAFAKMGYEVVQARGPGRGGEAAAHEEAGAISASPPTDQKTC